MNILLSDIAFDGKTLGLLLLGIIFSIVLLIFGIKKWFSYMSKKDLAASFFQTGEKTFLVGRNKYPAVDAFKHSRTFFSLGVAIALVTAVLTFNWTTYEEEIDISIYEKPDEIDNIVEGISMPPPKPPPPPLPPPIIDEVLDDLLEEDEIDDFIDRSIDMDTKINQDEHKFTEGVVEIPADDEFEEKFEPLLIFAEQMPRFPGCEDTGGSSADKKACAETKLMQFIYKNIKYPSIASQNGIEGRCYVSFVVEKNGKVTNIKLQRDIGGQCGKESLRVVNLMVKENIQWVPGKQAGQKVRVQFNLPIHFKLQK